MRGVLLSKVMDIIVSPRGAFLLPGPVLLLRLGRPVGLLLDPAGSEPAPKLGQHVLHAHALQVEQDHGVVEHVGHLARRAILAFVVLERLAELTRLLPNLLAQQRWVIEQLAGPRRLVTLLHNIRPALLDGLLELVQGGERLFLAVMTAAVHRGGSVGAVHLAVVARVRAGVAGGTVGDAEVDERVLIAVEVDGLHGDEVAGGLALGPLRLPAAREEGRLALGDCGAHGGAIGETLHENRAGVHILGDGDDQILVVVLQAVQELLDLLGLSRGGHDVPGESADSGAGAKGGARDGVGPDEAAVLLRGGRADAEGRAR
mmetsp:Transcript_4798/g.21718  ORF Transcript_4798/g.21718 Transcript_4798/m.21718 type:complete len:317 (+) Transcript_4798:722-1672(+)